MEGQVDIVPGNGLRWAGERDDFRSLCFVAVHDSMIGWLRGALRSPGVGGVLARGSIGAFAVRAGAVLLLLGMHVLLARILGVTGYGHYVYAVTWVQVLALFSTTGMDSASARYVAEYLAKDEPALLNGFLRHAFVLAVAVSAAVAAALYGVVELLETQLDRELVSTLRWGCLLLPIVTLMEVRSGALRGFKRVIAARLPADVLRPGVVVGVVLVAYFLARDPLRAPAVMVVNIVASAAGLFVIETALRGCRAGIDSNVASATPPHHEWSRVAFQLLLVAGFGLILGHTDTLMLGALEDTAHAGIYAVTVRLAGFTSFALISVNVMIGPQIAELHARGQRRELQRVLTLGARASLVFAVPVASILLLSGGPVLGVFGVEFSQGYPAMFVLVWGQILGCASGSVGMLLTMTGRQQIVGWVFGLGAAVNIALNALLIPRLGMIGAALATAATMFAWNAILVILAMRDLRLDSTVFAMRLKRH